jgi:uncharacterized protein (DUF58 family)
MTLPAPNRAGVLPPTAGPPADRLPPTAGPFIDPQTLMSIRNLELRARVVVDGFWSGLHKSPHHGFSVEFTEYRQYTPGDDPRTIDWRVFARSDRYFIKRFEDETNLRCHLLVDSSRSMTFGSLGYTKAEFAGTLAATLAQFLYLQGDAVGLVTFDEAIRDYLPARHRTGQLRHLMVALEKPARGQSTSLTAPLQWVAETVRKRGLLVLISDFLAPLDTIEPHLTTLAAGGHEVILFQVLDPAETAFNFQTPAMFEDAESGRSVFIDPASARSEYLRKLQAHSADLRALSERQGMTYIQLDTNRPLELALFEFLRARMQSGRRVRRTQRFASPRAA